MAKSKENTFVLVSLKDEEAKKLGQVISSETARQILGMLAEKKYSESELAKKMNIPLSTVHYNLQALVNAKLATADEYHYSKKGKEVLHYGLANKYVIIAPSGAPQGVLDKLKSLLPVALLVAAAAWAIEFFGNMQPSGQKITAEAAPMAMQMAERSAIIADGAAESMSIAKSLPEPATGIPLGVWFAMGAAFAIILYIIIEVIRSKKR